MRLVSLAFRELAGQDNEWSLDRLTLEKVNLIVGKNATGKTRTLNVIHFLSKLLSGEKKEVFSQGSYEVEFRDGTHDWHYFLEFSNYVVTKEDLKYDSRLVLQRSKGGYGRILAEDIEGIPIMIKFDVPNGQIAAFAKRDDAQHSFLTAIHRWADSVRHFALGGGINPSSLALAMKQTAPIPVNEKNTAQLVPIFDKARSELGPRFVEAVIADMQDLGYEIDEIEIRRPNNLIADPFVPGEVVGVSVKERGLRCFVDQSSISAGMFRALSLLAQLNYYILARKDTCILADDIGEGLDFDRSRALIELLRSKALESDAAIQLIMTTNDRFVMNSIPLEEWTVLQRAGHRVRVHNYANSKQVFDEFKFTGLSNFDFLATDFLSEATDEEVAIRE